MRTAFAISLLAALLGCAPRSPLQSQPPLVQPDYKIVQAYHARSGSAETPDDRLRAVTFQRIHGLSRPAALAYLQADGFQCQGVTCVLSIRKKLGADDATFALSVPKEEGLTHRRAYMQSYSLSLVAERIEDPEEIYADAIFHSGLVPRLRSAYLSDLEVTND